MRAIYPIPIDVALETLRYVPDTGKFYQAKHLGGRYITNSHRGYVRLYIDGRRFPAHRVAWAMHYGEQPKGYIDHINHDPSDNRISNLRCVMPAGNSGNASLSKRNTSGTPGVCLRKNGDWRATIAIGSQRVTLGHWPNNDDAIFARKIAEKVLGYHENHGQPRVEV